MVHCSDESLLGPARSAVDVSAAVLCIAIPVVGEGWPGTRVTTWLVLADGARLCLGRMDEMSVLDEMGADEEGKEEEDGKVEDVDENEGDDDDEEEEEYTAVVLGCTVLELTTSASSVAFVKVSGRDTPLDMEVP